MTFLQIRRVQAVLGLLTVAVAGCSASGGNMGKPLAGDAATSESDSGPSRPGDAFADGTVPTPNPSAAESGSPVDDAMDSGQPPSDGPVPVNADAADAGGSAVGDGCAGLFCEDFEKGTIDPLVWSTHFSGKQPAGVVQTTMVAHGKYAVRFHAVNSDRAYSFIVTKNAPAGLRGHHFGRAYFYITPMPPTMHTEFLFSGTAGFPTLKYLEVAGIGSAWQLTFVDLATGGAESYHSGGSIPLVRWVCLEWEFMDTPDQATVFVDGSLGYTTPNGFNSGGKTSGLVGPFTDFGFGFYAWHPATYDFDVYYDDVVLDIKRVGCLP
ncbi:MAG: hypothetical protein M3O46_12735 [Myxococcota bacterium]|nr:hypothetical protein [Myxococcota bacterium]